MVQSLCSLCSPVQLVPVEDQAKLAESFMTDNTKDEESRDSLLKINRLMQRHSSNASVIFTALPTPPTGQVDAVGYMHDLDTLSSM